MSDNLDIRGAVRMEPLFDDGWIEVLHHTGGGYKANASDREHYHFIYEGEGKEVRGNYSVGDNISTSDKIYAAHTAWANTKAIGRSVACMVGADPSAGYPNFGSSAPMTREQFAAACLGIARGCIKYGTPVTRERVMTHAEVQPNLGIPQNGKWDITVLPWDPTVVGYRAVGDFMRECVRDAIAQLGGYTERQPAPFVRSILKRGNHGPQVSALQGVLAAGGFYSGRIDGDFGGKTDKAVRDVQSAFGLKADGVVGAKTWPVIDSLEAAKTSETEGVIADVAMPDGSVAATPVSPPKVVRDLHGLGKGRKSVFSTETLRGVKEALGGSTLLGAGGLLGAIKALETEKLIVAGVIGLLLCVGLWFALRGNGRVGAERSTYFNRGLD